MTQTNKLQPRERFLKDGKRADQHQELVLSPQFKEAIEIALLEYVMNLATNSLQSAAETAYKLEGARGFIQVFLNLGDQSKPIIDKPSDQLRAV